MEMTNVRAAILQELARRGRSIYWLSRHEKLTCGDQTAYRWLHEKTAGIATKHIDEMCLILGLKITRPKPQRIVR